MALFSILRGKAPDRGLAVKSLLTPVLFSMLARGEVTVEQQTLLAGFCRASPLFAGMTTEEIDKVISDVLLELAEDDPDVTIPNAISVLSKPLRETSLGLAITVSHVDGALSDEQSEVVDLLANQMGVSEKIVGTLKTAASIFQRNAAFSP